MDVPSTSSGAGRRRNDKVKQRETLDLTPRVPRPQPPVMPIAAKNGSFLPDPFYWPKLSQAEGKKVEYVLHRYKVNMSDCTNTDWLDFKESDHHFQSVHTRPTNSNAFIYGMSDCCNTVHSGMCWAVIVEAQVTPRSIILPIVEECVTNNIPMVCLNDLRNISASNFGIYTGCLGIKKGCLPELRQELLSISNNYKAMQLQLKYAQPSTMAENKEPGQNDKKRSYENDDPQTSNGTPVSKAHCPHTVTSETNEVLPALNTFRMVLKKSSKTPKKKAWLDIDKKEVVLITK